MLTRCVVARFLAAHPHGSLTVQVVDPSGGGTSLQALEPLRSMGSRLIAPPVTSPEQLGFLFADLVARVDMIRMAAQAGALDEIDGERFGARLVVFQDFPLGLDERGMEVLRLLIESGPSAGIILLLVANAAHVEEGSLAELVLRSSTLLPAVEASCIRDPWIGHLWTYTPDSHGGGRVVDSVYSALAGASLGLDGL